MEPICEECGNDEASLLGSCIPGEYYCTDCFLEFVGEPSVE